MRRRQASTTVLAAVLAPVLVLATACGDDEGDGGSDSVERIEITVEGDTVEPNGDRVQVDAGQPVDLVVTADAPGELHVHADPEQTFEYEAGETTIEMQIDRPGVVEVESHELDQLIVQLEVQ